MHPRWKVTMERYQEVILILSETIMKNHLKHPLAEKSRWRHIRLAIKPRYLGYHAWCIPDKKLLLNAIRKTRSLFQNSSWKIVGKRPLAEKSRWRHIRLAIKPRYLGNYASQINNYYGTLLGSHGRSFRIRHEHVSAARPGGGLTMTS